MGFVRGSVISRHSFFSTVTVQGANDGEMGTHKARENVKTDATQLSVSVNRAFLFRWSDTASVWKQICDLK